MDKEKSSKKPEKEERSESQIDDDILAEAQPIWKYLKESRQRAELEWFINEQAHDNNQFLYYNTATRSLQPVTNEQRRDKVTINRVKQQTRSVVSFLNQRKPFVQTMPGSQSDDAFLRSRKTKNLCDDWYDRLEMNKQNKKISKDGLIRGLGWSKISWSTDALAPTTPFKVAGEERTKQYGEVTFDHVDTFDIYPDPQAGEKKDLRYIAGAFPRTLGDLRRNKNYRNTDNLVSDNRQAASDLKQVQIRQSTGGQGSSGVDGKNDLATVVVIELFYFKWNDSKNKYWPYVVTMSESGVMLNHTWWELDEFPYEPFIADITGAMLRSKGVVSDIRDPNRAVNDLVSQILESARIMGKINWKMPRNANVNVITDETGQYIEYDQTPGGSPEQVQPAGVPAHIPNLVGYLENAIQDIGGAHDASLGKSVFNGASGSLVQSLQAGDASSLAMYRDNYDDFLVRCFKLMLKTAKHYGKSKRIVRNSEADEFGQYSWTELSPSDISTDDDIRVKSGSNLPFTSEQRQEFFINLYKNGIIKDPNAILKLLDIPDLINVLGDDELDIRRELDNIRDVIESKSKEVKVPDPVPGEKHDVHIQTLDKFIRGERFEKLTPEQRTAILDHRDKHAKLSADQAKSAAMSQYEPIKRSESVSLSVKDMGGATPIERSAILGQFNLESDAADIQRRGGLVVQDEAAAEEQAQNEDIDLMDGRPVPISLGDNHEVHLETHQQLLQSPEAGALPPNVVTAIRNHIAAHEKALKDLQPSPGLVPMQEGEPTGEQPI